MPVYTVRQGSVNYPYTLFVHIQYCRVDEDVFKRIWFIGRGNVVSVVEMVSGWKGDENKVPSLYAVLI